MSDNVHSPQHYMSGGMEALDVIEAFFHDNYHRGQVFKYIARAGKKDPAKELEDLQKAEVYLKREIARLQYGQVPQRVLLGVTNLDEPRMWGSIDRVPPCVVARDKEGDLWRWSAYDLEWNPGGAGFRPWGSRGGGCEPDQYAPFTEVLEGTE